MIQQQTMLTIADNSVCSAVATQNNFVSFGDKSISLRSDFALASSCFSQVVRSFVHVDGLSAG